jgi:hypothetical protein
VRETTADRDVQKRKKNKEKKDDEKRVGSLVVDLRQPLLRQADGQPTKDRQSKASADKLDTAVSNMSKESRDLESTGGRPHPGEPRSDVDEGKQKSDQAVGSLIASRIERDKSQVGFTCVSVLVPYLIAVLAGAYCIPGRKRPLFDSSVPVLKESQNTGM